MYKKRTGTPLFDNVEAEFFDDGIREDVLCDSLDLRLGFVTGHAVECKHEELSLANVFNLGITERSLAHAESSVLEDPGQWTSA